MKAIKGSGIYVITCLPNGKQYIGSTGDCAKRWRAHFCLLKSGNHHSPHLQAAWNKYGEEAFQIDMLLYCDGKNDLIEWEQLCLDNLPALFNMCRVAERRTGYKATPETIEKLKLVRAANWADPAYRAKQLGSMGRNKGFKHPPEFGRKISEKNKNRTLSEEHKLKISQATTRFYDSVGRVPKKVPAPRKTHEVYEILKDFRKQGIDPTPQMILAAVNERFPVAIIDLKYASDCKHKFKNWLLKRGLLSWATPREKALVKANTNLEAYMKIYRILPSPHALSRIAHCSKAIAKIVLKEWEQVTLREKAL